MRMAAVARVMARSRRWAAGPRGRGARPRVVSAPQMPRATAAAARVRAMGSWPGHPVARVPRVSQRAAKASWISEPIRATRRRHAARAAGSGRAGAVAAGWVRVVMVSHSFRAAARPWSRHHVKGGGKRLAHRGGSGAEGVLVGGGVHDEGLGELVADLPRAPAGTGRPGQWRAPATRGPALGPGGRLRVVFGHRVADWPVPAEVAHRDQYRA